MSTIVSIRGTHGSGKSSIVRAILHKYPHTELKFDAKDKRPYSYLVNLPNGKELAVVGPYVSACGGCDAIQPYSDIAEYINGALANDNDVLFEGALVSSSYGSLGHLLNSYQCAGSTAYFAFLDTPVEECLRRVAERRAARGNLEPLNPKNTVVKFDNVLRTKEQMRKLGSAINIVDIDHKRPVIGVLKLFGVKIAKEPPWVPV